MPTLTWMKDVPEHAAREQASGSGSEPAVMARSLGGLYLAGATIGLASLFLPRAPGTNVGALAANVGMAYVGGLLVVLLGRRLPVWSFQLALLAGTALVTRAVYYSGQGVSFYSVWYVWVALFAFSFFTRRQAGAHVGAVAVAYALVLMLRHDVVSEARWVTTIASLVIAGVFIDALVRRIRRQRQQAAEDAQNLATVIDAMHRIFQQPTVDAARLDLCATASRVARADGAVLWEPRTEHGDLVVVAAAGEQLAAGTLSLSDDRAGAVCAYLSGEPNFAVLADSHRRELDPGGAARISCGLWQPVQRDQTTVAVLALYWAAPVGEPEKNVRATLVLLAAQAAIAIERTQLLGRVERMARTDELTGLPNRRAWREALPREMARAKRERWPLCVAMIDVDGLKQLNDSRGHHAGDQLLKQNAAAWSSALRPVDLLARYGGDEFAAILSGCRLQDAHALLERLVEVTPEDRSFSAGVTEWDGIADADALLAEADARLYLAKASRDDVFVIRS
jgi:diguanylate cyclase (GGDEF)-like protein